jgi:hypothetical protein
MYLRFKCPKMDTIHDYLAAKLVFSINITQVSRKKNHNFNISDRIFAHFFVFVHYF